MKKFSTGKKKSRLEIKISTWDKNLNIKKFWTWYKNLDMKKKSRLELKHLNLNKKDLDLNWNPQLEKKKISKKKKKISTTFVQYGSP